MAHHRNDCPGRDPIVAIAHARQWRTALRSGAFTLARSLRDAHCDSASRDLADLFPGDDGLCRFAAPPKDPGSHHHDLWISPGRLWADSIVYQRRFARLLVSATYPKHRLWTFPEPASLCRVHGVGVGVTAWATAFGIR